MTRDDVEDEGFSVAYPPGTWTTVTVPYIDFDADQTGAAVPFVAVPDDDLDW